MKSVNIPTTIEPDYMPLVQSLELSVKRNLADGLLLSGGLDTSILACLAAKYHKPYCITIALKNAPAPDVEYARKIAAIFKLEHYVHYFGIEELEEGIFSAIKVLKSFDPMEIRNSAAAYVALKVARDKGLRTAMTGDGGDELFAGYSFFFELDKEHLDSALEDMWTKMRFSSTDLADYLGITAKLPFLDPEFKTLAMNMDSGLKINKEKDTIFGKWILRKAFENLLSPEIVWRVKAPLEVGTGTTTLPSLYESVISDSEFSLKKGLILEKDKVEITTKEHLHYYEIYKKLIGVPGLRAEPGRKCPGCGSNVKEKTNYCPTCGAYPIYI
jgi:asparagine synthase (glutamine-hydrolysing)